MFVDSRRGRPVGLTLRPRPRILAIVLALPLFAACSGAKSPAATSRAGTAAKAAPRAGASLLPITKGTPKPTTRELPSGFVALNDELERAMTTLGASNPPVHHLAYTVTHHEDETIMAEYGVIDSHQHREGRSIDVDVRVGTPAFDSHHASRNVAPVGAYVQALPLGDSDPVALRQVA